MIARIGVAAIATAVAFALAHPAMSSPAHRDAVAFGKPGDHAAVDRTVRVTANHLSYDPDQLVVHQGETIRFVVTNASDLPHDFTLGPPEVQAAHRREMAEMMMQDNNSMHHQDPNAVFLEPGETGELVWTFTKAGSIEFACNVPGHYEAGMKGEVTVQH